MVSRCSLTLEEEIEKHFWSITENSWKWEKYSHCSIGATLLEGGKTAHSAFMLPLNSSQYYSALYNISKQSSTACAGRVKAYCLERVDNGSKRRVKDLDQSLKDLKNNNKFISGVTVLSQVTLDRYYLWYHVKHRLMRVRPASSHPNYRQQSKHRLYFHKILFCFKWTFLSHNMFTIA